ncbi:DUF3231 family protein [Evansella clarkii]|uniref:DUF3231 family protein n=1 Tax=Evansella clarkii TaxID=79879 RepID=UPI000B44671B|nr:DUF3231 family protein [Evansella clarkii]
MASNNIDLTSAEMGYLWYTYQAQSMNYYVLKYFNAIVEDPEIKQINDKNMELCGSVMSEIKTIFLGQNMPVPEAFSDSDILSTEEKLFTDPFILFYQWFIAKGNLNFGSISINTIAREDVFNLFNRYISESLKILNDARLCLLNKGLWIRAPYIPVPEKNEFVQKESFLNGWFGRERPLLGIEIASIFYNLVTNTLGISLTAGFMQVTNAGKLNDYFKRGKEISSKHVEVMSKLLKKEELPVPSTWNPGVTSSTAAPFSDKLMLNLIAALNAQGMSNYGAAVSNVLRRDLAMDFTRLSAEVAIYAEDGLKILIEHGWMEQPPQKN